jgi:hypothetical protein
MMNNFPIYPKVGNHVKFEAVFTVYEHNTGEVLDIQIGTVAEVVQVEAYVGRQEVGNYAIYLGLSDARVIKMDYTTHYRKITIIPSTPAGQLLYGSK